MTTKMYKAFVKSKETGELTIIESEYTSKKDFARDLRANGYAVKFISTPEKFDEDSENYNWELKRRKNVREAMKQHKANKEQEVQETVEQTVETIAEGTSEVETTEQAQAEENKDTFEYRNYIISGNERTGIIAIDNHGNFSPKVYKTVEEAKKAVDEDIEYAEKKYAEMEAEQTELEETAEIETAKPETAETDDSGFEYYSVETAYEVDFRDRQNEVFKTYSEAEKTAGDNIILEVDLIVRNDKKAVSEHDKEVFEDETDEIECRCIWYHRNGVKGMIAQDTKRVIKKPETAEVSKEVVDNRKEVNSTSFIQQLYDAEYSKTLTVQGGIERFLKLAKEFVKNKSTEMSLIVDTAAQVLHDKYKLDYGTIETLEIEAYNS